MSPSPGGSDRNSSKCCQGEVFYFVPTSVVENGAESRGAEIKMPPGTEITNCGSSSFLFKTDLKKVCGNKSWFAEKRSF
jgi:hypothetical protein